MGIERADDKPAHPLTDQLGAEFFNINVLNPNEVLVWCKKTLAAVKSLELAAPSHVAAPSEGETPRMDKAKGSLSIHTYMEDQLYKEGCQLERELAQETDIRSDREIMLQALQDALKVPAEPHQTYWERLLEAAAQTPAVSSTREPSVTPKEWEHLVECARREGFIAGKLAVSATERVTAHSGLGKLAAELEAERWHRAFKHYFHDGLEDCRQCGLPRTDRIHEVGSATDGRADE